jgi:hypothetical protein
MRVRAGIAGIGIIPYLLDGDDAIKARVAGLVHLTHPARANGREDFVRTESFACGKRHLLDLRQFTDQELDCARMTHTEVIHSGEGRRTQESGDVLLKAARRCLTIYIISNCSASDAQLHSPTRKAYNRPAICAHRCPRTS